MKPKSMHVPIATRMENQRKVKREMAEFLKTLDPKVIDIYYENGIAIKVYEAR